MFGFPTNSAKSSTFVEVNSWKSVYGSGKKGHSVFLDNLSENRTLLIIFGKSD